MRTTRVDPPPASGRPAAASRHPGPPPHPVGYARHVGRPRIGVVVVHGIGDQKAGDTLRELVGAVANHDRSGVRLDAPDLLDLEDGHASTDDRAALFPVHVRRGRIHGMSATFAEVFWGSASRLPEGLIGIALGFVQLLLGIDVLIRASWQRAPLTALTTLIGSWLTHSIFYFALLLIALFISYVFATMVGNVVGIFVLLSLIVILIYILIARLWRDMGFHAYPLIAVAAIAVSLGSILFYVCRGFFIHDYFLTSAAILLLTLVGVFFLALGALTISLLVWLAHLVLAGVVTVLCGSDRFERLATLVGVGRTLLRRWPRCGPVVTSGSNHRRRLRQSCEVSLVHVAALSLQFGLWTLIASALSALMWRVQTAVSGSAEQHPAVACVRDPDPARAAECADLLHPWEGETSLIHWALAADGLQWVFVLALLVIAVLLFPMKTKPTALMILAQISLVSLTALGSIALWTSIPQEFTLVVDMVASLDARLGGAISKVAALVAISQSAIANFDFAGWSLAILASVASVAFWKGLDLTNDVLNYLRWNTRFPETPTTEQQRPYCGRFNQVVRWLFEQESVDHLVIVSHSQGTIMAVDELNWSFKDCKLAEAGGRNVYLITMGSPLAHLYQRYFPYAYPDWEAWSGNQYCWQKLFDRVHYWRNLYRPDDLVGTVACPDQSAVAGPRATETGWRDEAPLAPGGHTRYWTSRQLAKICGRLFESIRDQSR